MRANAPHQAPVNGIAVNWSLCMRLLAAPDCNDDDGKQTKPFEGREVILAEIVLMAKPIDVYSP